MSLPDESLRSQGQPRAASPHRATPRGRSPGQRALGPRPTDCMASTKGKGTFTTERPGGRHLCQVIELSAGSTEHVNIVGLIRPTGTQNSTCAEFLPKTFDLNQILSRLWGSLHDNNPRFFKNVQVIKDNGGGTVLETTETNETRQTECNTRPLFGACV